jgi:UMF1 family MFS transporter
LTLLPQKNQTNFSKSKFQIFVWTLFDFANTSYSIVVVTFLFAVYFKKTIAEGEAIGDLYWSIATGLSMLITALISPILGAIADYSAGKKRFLLFFTLICIASTAMLYLLKPGMILSSVLLFILANVGFEAGLVFYDSFLPEITTPKNYGRVSGYGYAMGYLGSLASLLMAFPLIKANLIKETFPLSAFFFLVFALPLFLFIKDNDKKDIPNYNYLKIGFSRVLSTLKNLKNYKNLSIFLLSFFFYIEGVNTIIYFSGNYASTTLHFEFIDLILFFIIVQSTAILGSILFGILADSLGQKKTLILSLYIWLFTIILAYLTSSKDEFLIKLIVNYCNCDFLTVEKYAFYFIGLLAGSVMGATQSISRSFLSKLIPIERKTEFFGFFSFFGKSSAILGPVVFGLVSFLSQDQRYSILSIGVFFIIGLSILYFVKEN